MQTRKFDELIAHFNRKAAEMDIDTKYKIELLGMVSALGFAHEKELTAQPEQRTGKWIIEGTITTVRGYWAKCSACGHTSFGGGRFCKDCGAKMEGDAE